MVPAFSKIACIASVQIFDELSLADNVLAAFDATMTIPLNGHSTILDFSTNVETLLTWTDLPKTGRNISHHSNCLSEPFFSSKAPSLPRNWTTLDIPLWLAFAIASAAGQAWVNGMILVIHWEDAEILLPPWIIHWWLKMALEHAVKWVQEVIETVAEEEVLERFSMSLLIDDIHCLKWGVAISGYAKEATLIPSHWMGM
ncbi:hypothetical protein C8J56DRAFT_1063107 [Mycena floridula]|nr:hypothetical protein C8J56DRAFT_1063107 [Mycena floridula]